MKNEKVINSYIMEIPIEIKNIRDELYIEVRLSKKINAFVRVYNPSNDLIGELSYGYHNFINKIYYGKSNTTMNGLEHSLVDGMYRFFIIILEPDKITKDLRIALSIKTFDDVSEMLDKDELINNLGTSVFQEIPWFHSNGDLIDFNKVVCNEKRYYKGDFHAHTFYSDGELSGEEAKSTINKQGLDFIALTEHNRIPFGFKDMDVLIVPSFEFTLPSGHINIHSIKNIDLFGDCINHITDMSDLMSKVVDRHYLYSNISVNHMFLDQWSFTEKDLDIRKVNTIEIMCDPTYPTSGQANDKAVEFIDFLWNKGWKIYGIGGSDSHNKLDDFYEGANQPSIYGDPSTYVFCDGLSVDNVVNGIKKGNTYVTRYEELYVAINNGEMLPGQEIKEKNNIEYKVEIKNFGSKYVHDEYIGKFILNGKAIKTVTLNKENTIASLSQIDSLLENQDYWWLRFGLYDASGHVVAYINPVYSGQRNCDINKLDILIKEFDKRDD